jgi:hypothetical protein
VKTFSRNVITQVVERHLLQGLYNNIFHPNEFFDMGDDMILRIANEDEAVRQKRKGLKVKIEAILNSLSHCDNIPTSQDMVSVRDLDILSLQLTDSTIV